MEEQLPNPLENDNMIPDDVQEKLAKVIERYQQLNDEEKEEFQKGAFDVLTKNLHKLPRNTILPTWLAPYQSYILFFFAVSIVALLLAIFARRLYRRTKEREQQKEEKRKLRQQKAEMKKKKRKQM
ncbi:PREDICTED: uncharacterized protein LOC105457728 [Wasmannia auropunctata]|uniref:uncharacterized protein LOC105457728 n=1 Tax=Wasmannia auropunctata TaxID=64793 RepID=UPI0005EF1232|nr:PREDICTED: uncharacterized protein LOC105457728 [Wasmannia auropunctata]